MITPRIMLTNKKHLPLLLSLSVLLAAAWLTGCTPPGPRALLEGRRLIEHGDYEPAVEELKLATSLMQTNASAWNYLGLAYHHAGHPNEAYEAYQKSLRLNHDLVWVHYNIGCLLLEQNRTDAARDEFTAFVLHQGNSLDGRLKLGTAQLRLGDLANAEKNFNEALRINPQNAEALNDLGVIQAQRRRYHDAITDFNSALKQQPACAPALLNLAVTLQESNPNARPLALQKYQEYLALNPRPANFDAVNIVAHQLDAELNPSHAMPNIASAAPAPAPAPRTNYVTTRASATDTQRSSDVAASPRAIAMNSSRSAMAPAPDAASNPENIHLSEPVYVRSADDSVSSAPAISGTTAPSDTGLQVSPAGNEVASTPRQQKRGFFQRLNPFRRDGAQQDDSASPPPSMDVTSQDSAPTRPVSSNPPTVSRTAPPRPVAFPRYTYQSPARPPAGNRAEAQRFFTEALQVQRDGNYADAVSLYRSAVQADPSFFEAQSNLGLAAYSAGDLQLSLYAYETALAIQPDSFNARYNFALALKRGGYFTDAAQELERLLMVNPNETAGHLASAHLMLASLYSEQFHRPSSARPHYLKVLELDPGNSQGTAIRYWLRDNP